ncbi:MAG: carboxypeptidase regulatory-like domain-containing protein [Acidobacteria bacterium]|nr:carboxypeptidase regulatory-like domain-containing protein [Acidobacteriota bacterium]
MFAQAGRVGGVVKDEADQPIKGATVRAENPAASPSTFTTTTDAKGRFSIIGLKGGEWTFTAEAPGYAPPRASSGSRRSRRTRPSRSGWPRAPQDPVVARWPA